MFEGAGGKGGRRGFLRWAAAAGGALGLGRLARAHHTETHFGETTAHKLVYQLNKADPAYIGSILFSVGEMLRKYGDDIELVVTVIGPGLHLLAKKPGRPIPPELRQRAASLAQYGVAFHACGNTLKALGWTADDLVDFAQVVPIGADDLMRLQERGFAYISW